MTTPGSNVTLGRTGKETLIFHVNGSFTSGANGNLVPYGSTTNEFTRSIFYVKSGDSQINANGNVGDMRDPTAIQLYIYQNDKATINTTGYEHTLELKGNGSFYGFMFAPFANLSAQGTSDHSGALWVKSLETNGNFKFWQGIFSMSRLMVSVDTKTPTNQMGAATSYQRVAVP